MALFFQGLAFENLQKYDEAAEAFAAGGQARLRRQELRAPPRRGPPPGRASRGGQEDPRRAREAGGLVGRIPLPAAAASSPPTASWPPAAAEFEKALSLDHDHNGALFELAYINDLFGNDETAVDFYKRCTERPPVPLAALINLGVLYEDEMRFREAEQCYRQVLAFDPNHPRARLFFKDCRASKGMYYDEEAETRLHRPQAAPGDPRHRLRALGPEPELPAEDEHPHARRPDPDHRGRAPGQQELRRDVALRDQGDDDLEGPAAGHGPGRGRARPADHDHRRPSRSRKCSQEEKALLAKPISDLNLSVRARKCMSKLSIQTVGELIIHTGDELLECKNFGVTSLNEVREKLTELGLKLKNE